MRSLRILGGFLLLGIVVVGLACGSVDSKTIDARAADTPAGPVECAFDTSSFDDGCGMAP